MTKTGCKQFKLIKRSRSSLKSILKLSIFEPYGGSDKRTKQRKYNCWEKDIVLCHDPHINLTTDEIGHWPFLEDKRLLSSVDQRSGLEDLLSLNIKKKSIKIFPLIRLKVNTKMITSCIVDLF